MRVAVVGATGTIGRPLVEALARTHDVVGIARRPPRSDHRLKWIAADATDAVAIRSALEGIEVVTTRALPRKRRLRGTRSDGREGGCRKRSDGRCHTGGLSGRARREGVRALTAPSQPSRDGSDFGVRTGAGDHTACGDDRRAGQRRVRNDPRTRRSIPVMLCPRWVSSIPNQSHSRTSWQHLPVCAAKRLHRRDFRLGGPK